MLESDDGLAPVAQIVEFRAAVGEEDVGDSQGRKRSLNAMLDVKEIFKRIPHRYAFLLVDRIAEIHGDERIVGIKNVSINERFFQGHFANRPVMPGVFVVEVLAQLGGNLAVKTGSGRGSIMACVLSRQV